MATGGLRMISRRAVCVFVALAALAAGCGKEEDAEGPAIRGIDGDQVVTPEQLASGARDSSGKTAGSGGSDNGIPLEEEEDNFGSSLGTALKKFNTCTEREGWQFVGFPDSESSDPIIGDPAYAEAMGSCANESNILGVLRDAQKRLAEMTPDEVKAYNENIVNLRECLLRRGWEWGELQPDENGVLGAGLPTYPPVENALETLEDPNARRDLDECGAAQVGF